MFLLLHGVAGGWDEIAIAAVAFGVLWAAVKLAGRKPAASDEDEDEPAKIEGAADGAIEPRGPEPSRGQTGPSSR